MVFSVPEGAEIAPKDREKAAKLGYVGNYTRLGNSNWFTNIDHGRRHQPLSLMTITDNLKFSKHREIKEFGYQKYDNYDAIEVPYTDSIPSDYNGVMGVPISFLTKYCPEQFEIIGLSLFIAKPIKECIPEGDTYQQGGNAFYLSDGEHHHKRLYGRIAIKRRG